MKMNYIEAFKISSNTMDRLRTLLQEDIAQDGNKSYQPRSILRSNRITKKALEYNRRLIREGRINTYLDKTKVYNRATDRFISSPIDKRSGKIKKSFLKKNEVFGSVVAPKKETLNFRYTWGGGSTNWELTNAGRLNSNSLLEDLIKQNKIVGNYRLIITKNGETIRDGNYVIGSNFWKENRTSFLGQNSGVMIWNEDMNNGDVVHFIFTKEKLLPTTFYNQKYREGVTHCVLTPIKEWGYEKLDNSKSKSAKKRYNAFVNKIDEFENVYAEGIPHDELHSVCEKLQIAIDLSQPFGNKTERFVSNKMPLKVFNFINTRLNHVDFGTSDITLNEVFKSYDPVIVTRQDLIDMEKKCIENDEFYIYNKDKYGLNAIRTLTNYYRVNNDYKIAVNQFEYDTKLKYCGFDTAKYPDLYNFINAGTHFNGTIDWFDTKKYRLSIPSNVKHIDMEKAYTQFKNCKWYNGFCGKITNFRRVDNYSVPGLYSIKNLSLKFCNKKFKQLNEKLNWFYDGNVYTNAELDCLKHYGGKFEVVYGAYGVDIDFEFPEYMYQKEVFEFEGKDIKIPYYSKWAGMCARVNKVSNFYMKGDLDYLKNISTDAKKWFDGDECRVSFDNQYQYTKKHITAQITAYQRLTMLDQLLEMDLDKVIRVCVDGIYYKEHEFNILKCFGDKSEKMTFGNDPCENYLSELIVEGDIDFKCVGKKREYFQKELFNAEGGNGKTYYNLIDKGFIGVVYVPHSEKLASAKNREFGVRTSNHTRLLTEPFSKQKGEIYKNGVYVVDECSMITEEQKQYLLDNIFGQVIFCGDLAGQLLPIGGKPMNVKGFDNIDKICVKNYRFKDSRILKLCRDVRKVIADNGFLIFDSMDVQKIKIDDVANLYKKEDILLVSRGAKKNKTSNLNTFWCEKFPDIEKYKVEKNSRKYKNGDIVFEKVPDSEFRHGYTIHSVQGETFKENIFIDMRHMTDIRMLYTAISRANYWKQIYCII